MGFINLMIESNAKITVKNNQLFLENDKSCHDFPLEDLNSVLIENLMSTVTIYTLSKLAEKNVLIYICDEKHLPSAYLLPFFSHYNQLKVFKVQKDISQPLRKQLWSKIVENKILNQHRCLLLAGKDSSLLKLARKIKSGDTTNVEAEAASKFFKAMYGQSYTRKTENNINSALNYGYAILRGQIARCVVSHGLLPFLGINHHNIFNNYNLADDLIEVFRPFVDLLVYQNADLIFDKEFKHILFNLQNIDCLINGGYYPLSYAVDFFVQSFIDSISESKITLKFPELTELKNHEYK